MHANYSQAVINLLKVKGVVRARELALLGVKGATLQQLLQKGCLVRIERGLYALASRSSSGLDELALLSIKYEGLVFCLLTALQVHGLTTQSPHEVWVAIGQKSRTPKIAYPPLRVLRMGDIDYGTTRLKVDGSTQIPVTNIAKTIADCFKFRNKIGLDVALEALREAWQQKRVTMDELWVAAEHCRVTNVIRPYLESLV
jgi:predicted transcriptional regulator of viral defense system